MNDCEDFFEIHKLSEKPEIVIIHPAILQRYCADCLGFYNYVDYAGKYNLVHVTQGCIVSEASVQDLKHAIKQDIESRGISPKVWEVMAAKNYLTEHCLHLLPKLEEVNFHPSTASTAFFYYSNGVVKISNGTPELLSYAAFGATYNAYIWKAQISKRDFQMPENGIWDGQFYKFLSCICNHDTRREESLLTLIGYLLHPYKDPANTKAIILLDEQADFSGEAHGGTGKSLIGRAIELIVSTVWRDAKNFNCKETFATDDIKSHSRVIVYDDVKRDFNFEELYSMITGDMQVKRKYKDSTIIPFAHSPKILISSNSMVKGTGGSADERRKVEFEVAPFFNLNHTPVHEFGNRLFIEWDNAEWNRFDAAMMHCVRCYIHHGIIQPKHINLAVNKLKAFTHPDFVTYMDTIIQENNRFDKAKLLAEFQQLVPSQKFLSAIAFKGWIDKWAEHHSYSTSHFKSNGSAMVIIDTANNPLPNVETE